MADVDAKVAAGELTSFADWEKLVRHPADPGILHAEGAELEGELAEGEEPWLAEEDARAVAADDADVRTLATTAEASAPAPVVEALPGDTAATVAAATAACSRLQSLKRLRAEALVGKVPAAFFNIDREVGQLERGLHAKTPDERASAEVLRRAVERAQEAEAAGCGVAACRWPALH